MLIWCKCQFLLKQRDNKLLRKENIYFKLQYRLFNHRKRKEKQ